MDLYCAHHLQVGQRNVAVTFLNGTSLCEECCIERMNETDAAQHQLEIAQRELEDRQAQVFQDLGRPPRPPL